MDSSPCNDAPYCGYTGGDVCGDCGRTVIAQGKTFDDWFEAQSQALGQRMARAAWDYQARRISELRVNGIGQAEQIVKLIAQREALANTLEEVKSILLDVIAKPPNAATRQAILELAEEINNA